MADHFIDEDIFGRTISCSDERWFGHVLVDHPEMSGFEEKVISAIRTPLWIAEDKTSIFREVFYNRFSGDLYYTRVVVEFLVAEFGEVKTAFLSTSGKSGERIKWPPLNRLSN